MIDYHQHIYEYVRNDFLNPKISSIKFSEFIKKNNLLETNKGICIDLGSGPGSGTYYLAKKFPDIEFLKAGYLNDHPQVIGTFEDRVRGILIGDNNMNCQLCKYREQVLGFEAHQGLPQMSHHHHVEGIGTNEDEQTDDHAHAQSHDHDHHHTQGRGHDHGHSHDHHHAPHPHADHPHGPAMRNPEAAE